MPIKNRKFTIIPDNCYSSGLFKITPECLFFKLLSLAQKNGYCNASDQWLSRTFNAPIRTIQSQLNKLEKRGLIKRSSKHKKLDVKERKIYITKRDFDTQKPEQNYKKTCLEIRRNLSKTTQEPAIIQYRDSIEKNTDSNAQEKPQETNGFTKRENELAENLCSENVGFTKKQAYDSITNHGFEKTNAVYSDVINESNIVNKGGAIQYRLKNTHNKEQTNVNSKALKISQLNWETLDKLTREPLKKLKSKPYDKEALGELETVLNIYPTDAAHRPFYETLPDGKTATVNTVCGYIDKTKGYALNAITKNQTKQETKRING